MTTVEKNALGINVPRVPEKKSNRRLLLWVAITFLGVSLVAGGVTGYGFYNGSKIKNYAIAAEKMMVEPERWEGVFDESETQKVKKELEKIEKYCDEQLTILEKPAPKKAQKLQEDLREYFKISKQASVSLTEIVEWTLEIEDANIDLKELENLDVSTPEGMTKSLEEGKRQIDSTVVKMEKMNVPESLKKDHEAVKTMFTNLSKAYDSIITGLKNNDLTTILTSGEELTAAMEGFDPESFGGDLGKTFERESEKADALEKDVKSEIIELKTVKFSF